jgi:uncharacterized hydrophobic protein (TIGR00271 family)
VRQLLVQVPRGEGERVLELARKHEAMNVASVPAAGLDGPADLVLLHVSNGRVGPLIEDLQQLPDLHVTLPPSGVIALQPPADEAPEQVREVEAKSAIEVFLGGLQSVGSWKGFLGYAVAAGIVVWIGLFTNTIFLLIAAMLIAPFAGPAMNVAMGTARGDWNLIRRGLLRYFAALAVTIGVCVAASLMMRQEIATQQMVENSAVSSVAVLLPLVAGAAGAHSLAQSDRNSLVSGAAPGVLIAASIAPPAGVIGMAGAVGKWDMVWSGVFLLLLQVVAINLSGAVVFRIYGLTSERTRYERGKAWLFPASLAATLAALGGLLFWQFGSRPALQRATRAERAAREVQRVVDDSSLAKLVEANVRFTRANIGGQNTLLAVVYVQRGTQTDLPDAEIARRLTRRIQDQILAGGFNVTPLVQVTVLNPPTLGAGG